MLCQTEDQNSIENICTFVSSTPKFSVKLITVCSLVLCVICPFCVFPRFSPCTSTFSPFCPYPYLAYLTNKTAVPNVKCVLPRFACCVWEWSYWEYIQGCLVYKQVTVNYWLSVGAGSYIPYESKILQVEKWIKSEH